MAAAAVRVDPYTEEVRVAMALNGGASLAVWMGGCAVELDSARRADVAEADAAGESLPGPGRIYHAICDAFDRRFVVDILTGASAGGINGALLAAAMRHGRRLDPDFLRNRWLALGDFTQMLQATSEPSPESLMRGSYFHDQLVSTFKALLDREPSAADREAVLPPPSQRPLRPSRPVLDVTVTNVYGEPRGFRDAWGEELVAREYRARFRFRNDDDFVFDQLADAGRATAAFPGAFEPFQVQGASAALAGIGPSRWAVDGGLLDNAPIRAAVDLIPTRQTGARGAVTQVKRWVCYLNADPPRRAETPDCPPRPELPDVIGYLINLPRNAPFVDQLEALDDATRRTKFARNVQLPLLRLDADALAAAATALLESYRFRRRVLSIEDLASDSVEAAKIEEALGAERSLPWIPESIAPAGNGAGWRWGVRATERVLHLLLDVLRGPLHERETPEAVRRELLAAWAEVDASLGTVAAVAHSFAPGSAMAQLVRELAAPGADVDAKLQQIDGLYGASAADLRDATRVAAGAVFGVRAYVPTLRDSLFGAVGDDVRDMPDAAFDALLARAFGIEVVRRAFSTDNELDTAQPLHFAQLTPVVAIRILSSRPCRDRPGGSAEVRADSPTTKLTGIRLAHFSAFYRRAWRANDFMWGRLDAATRIVDMMVDGARAKTLRERGKDAGAALAAALLPPDAGDEHRWLVHEALVDARAGDSAAHRDVAEALEEYPDDAPADVGSWLEGAICADLAADDDLALFTRVVCARAAQLEILRQELDCVFGEARGDVTLGCYTKELAFRVRRDDGETNLRATIEKMRVADPLPELLGRDSGDEGVSSLALRQITRTIFVLLGVLRTARIPLSRTLAIVRAPVLPVYGIASRERKRRIGVGIGFAAAAAYVAARIATTDADRVPTLPALWSAPVLLGIVAALGIVGVAAVPLLRALRADVQPQPPTAETLDSSDSPQPRRGSRLRQRLRNLQPSSRRLTQALWAAGIGLLGLVVPVVLALWQGGLGFAQVLVGEGAAAPPAVLAQLAVLVILGPAALRIVRIAGAGVIVRALEVLGWVGIAAAAAALLGWVATLLVGNLSFDDVAAWELVMIGCSAASVVVAAIYLIVSHR
jgi:predicted acylesterase/phospholipase RssA